MRAIRIKNWLTNPSFFEQKIVEDLSKYYNLTDEKTLGEIDVKSPIMGLLQNEGVMANFISSLFLLKRYQRYTIFRWKLYVSTIWYTCFNSIRLWSKTPI